VDVIIQKHLPARPRGAGDCGRREVKKHAIVIFRVFRHTRGVAVLSDEEDVIYPHLFSHDVVTTEKLVSEDSRSQTIVGDGYGRCAMTALIFARDHNHVNTRAGWRVNDLGVPARIWVAGVAWVAWGFGVTVVVNCYYIPWDLAIEAIAVRQVHQIH
jgi:hypothetical protein